jgi:2-polyprenyl-6-methoxyphenol hydroxylase-like FAD-dependent oxidoreductase
LTSKRPDLVIVGGGIAGGALALLMARAGAEVVVLEQQREFVDRVRGEVVWPWGVKVARTTGVEQIFLEAGALVAGGLTIHDEAPDQSEYYDVGEFVADVRGSLNISHPAACGALMEAAEAAGAEVHLGVRAVTVTPGDSPLVRWFEPDDGEQEAACGLVVGADGRRSTVRTQANIGFETDAPLHLVAGLLVEDVPGLDSEQNEMARESDLLFFSFPQAAGRARLYFCFPTDQRQRFAGSKGPAEFLLTTKLASLEGVADWHAAKAAGPCATFPGEDSRALHPRAEGVVLIGDAAGYENPLRGQGLSMALRDAQDVSEALLSDSATDGLADYAAARANRQRLANFGVALEAWANDGFSRQDPAARAARFEHIRSDKVLSAIEASFATGFDGLPPDLSRDEFDQRLNA